MIRPGLLALSILTALSITGTARGEAGMEPYAWGNRPVLLFAPQADTPDFQRQREILGADPAGLADRDIVVIAVAGHRVSVSPGSNPALTGAGLRAAYDVPAEGFSVLLVGKDTGVKLRRRSPVSLTELFATIDAMPMRQREMGDPED